MFIPPEQLHAMHESLLFRFALVVTDHEAFVLCSRPLVACGVGPVAITVLPRDQRRQYGPFYPGRRPSQYGLVYCLTHSGLWDNTTLRLCPRALLDSGEQADHPYTNFLS